MWKKQRKSGACLPTVATWQPSSVIPRGSSGSSASAFRRCTAAVPHQPIPQGLPPVPGCRPLAPQRRKPTCASPSINPFFLSLGPSPAKGAEREWSLCVCWDSHGSFGVFFSNDFIKAGCIFALLHSSLNWHSNSRTVVCANDFET